MMTLIKRMMYWWRDRQRISRRLEAITKTK
jgi:hypothetical protein